MGNNSLEGKKVLYIGQKFYNYHEKIINQLNDLGAEVVFYENKLFREDSILYPKDFISAVKRLLNPNFKTSYINSILKETEHITFDILFCIGGFSITENFVKTLKKRNKGIETVLYFWDSFKVWPFQSLIPLFDKVFSFERSDCMRYNIQYLPLFFSETTILAKRNVEKDIDLLYVGSVGPLSKNRFEIIALINDICIQSNLNSFLYILYRRPAQNLLIKAVNSIRGVVDLTYGSFIHSLKSYQTKYKFIYDKSLNSLELATLFSRSKCVIDIPVPGQSGLTMRTIESLAMGCKLITTNESIKEESFYSDEWISIINENNVEIDLDFLNNEPINSVRIQHLSLKNWLTTIINNK